MARLNLTRSLKSKQSVSLRGLERASIRISMGMRFEVHFSAFNCLLTKAAPLNSRFVIINYLFSARLRTIKIFPARPGRLSLLNAEKPIAFVN